VIVIVTLSIALRTVGTGIATREQHHPSVLNLSRLSLLVNWQYYNFVTRLTVVVTGSLVRLHPTVILLKLL
jgi:hypothetical protein